jgi:iron complex transport system substrate-binding protein
MSSMRTSRHKIVFSVVGVLAAALLAGCGRPADEHAGAGQAAPAAGTHTITDSTGTAVTLPDTVSRIADAWPAHNEVVQMLGAGDRIVATVLTHQSTPWLYTVQPSLDNAATVFTTSTVSTEKLIQARPDVLFSDKSTQIGASTSELGIPTVQLGFQTYDDLKKMVSTTADVLGADARAQAQAYTSYLDDKLTAVTTATSSIPEAQRPSVLHIYSLDPLVVDGTGSIIDAWITAAGGRNAAQVEGNARPVSTEQVSQWDPDVIILASSAFVGNDTGAQTLQKLTDDPFWSRMDAVRDHKAYINPTGGWHWDRYGIEEALQIQWAAKTLHPELFPDLDMAAETKSFYSRFLHFTLTDDQANRIIAGQDPA